LHLQLVHSSSFLLFPHFQQLVFPLKSLNSTTYTHPQFRIHQDTLPTSFGLILSQTFALVSALSL
jgi:hypothetical protein